MFYVESCDQNLLKEKITWFGQVIFRHYPFGTLEQKVDDKSTRRMSLWPGTRGTTLDSEIGFELMVIATKSYTGFAVTIFKAFGLS